MSDCIFCRILIGELPASFVYRNDRVAAFMDIQPVNPGHLLVVPVRHASYLADIDGSGAAELMRVAHAAAAALRASEVRCEGVNFFLADGEAAMQELDQVAARLASCLPGSFHHPTATGSRNVSR